MDIFVEDDHLIQGPRTLANIIDAIQTYPDAPSILLGSKAKELEPLNIKSALFFIDSKIIKLNFDDSQKSVTFGIARAMEGSPTLALKDD